MANQDYERKKRECFVQFCKDNGIDQKVNISIFDTFDQIFDRGYALGKQTETITQEDVEKASVEYADKTAKQYEVCNSEFVQEIMIAFEQGANYALGKQFGISEQVDAEEEEMLTVSRNNVMAYYRDAQEDEEKYHPAGENACNNMYRRAVGRRQMLKRLFGSKCLPDNVESSLPNVESFEPEPDKPKFKVGDKVRYRPSGEVYEVEGKTGRQHYALKGWPTDIVESDLEPYTRSNPNPSNSRELKLSTAEDKSEVNYVNLSQNIKNCDNRLQIAAVAMQGILSNENAIQYAINNFRLQDGSRNRYQAVAECSLAFVDALIAESEKRSEHGK